MKKVKLRQGDISPVGFFDSVDDPQIRELMAVRYVSYLLGEEGVTEDTALRECSRVSGLGMGELRKLWDKRGSVMGVSRAAYQMSGDLVRDKVRNVYHTFLDELMNRDLSGESVKVLLDALRVISQLEVNLGISLSADDPSRDGSYRDGNLVNVRNSNVIIVPMPEGAQSHTKEVDGRVVADAFAEGKTEKNFREHWAKLAELEERMESETELDALEQVKEMLRRVEARASGDRGDE